MPRKSKSFTLVFLNHGALDHESFDDVGKLRAKLAEVEAPTDVAVFASDPLPFTVSRDPVVTIGKARERKPRSKKPAAPRERKAAAKPAGTVVGGEFFEKPTNGAAPTADTAPTGATE